MMKKIITGLTIVAASLIVSIGTPSFSSLIGETAVIVEAASKVLTMEEAADKVIKTAHKAYDQKKKLSTTVTIKCPSKKSVRKYEEKLFEVIAEKELEEFYGVHMSPYDDNDMSFYDVLAHRTGVTWSEDNGKMSSDYKNGKLAIKFTNKGNNAGWRSLHDHIIYGKQNMRELREVTKGMSEIDKAWRIAVWLMVDHDTRYYGKMSKIAAGEKAVAKNKAQGFCSDLAGLYYRYASRMGLKVGYVSSNDHDSNWVVIDGKLYYLDMQSIDVDHRDYLADSSKDYNDENVDADIKIAGNKYVPDPTGRWLKVPWGYAEMMESGYITAYPWEVSEGEFCLLTEKQAKRLWPEEGFGKPSKWKHSENIKKYIPNFPKKNIKEW